MNKLFLFASLAILLGSCINKQNKSQNQVVVEPVKLQLTAYSNEFELFAETDPFSVGKPTGILSHFSHLPGFSALENGAVTIHLIVGDKEVSQTLEKPTRKGIYKFELKPEIQGTGKLVYDFKIDKDEYHLVVPEITVYADEQQAVEAAKIVVTSKTNTVVFTKEQSWKIEFSTEFPQVEPFGQVIKTTAQVQSAQGDEIIVTAKTNGIAVFIGDNVLEGKSVSAGQKLFSISGSEMSDNNSSVRFSEAKNNYEKTKADYERMKDLVADKIVSEKDFLKAKNEYDNAKVLYDNLNKNFSVNGQTVASPMNGFVKQLFIKNGQYVEAGQPIVTVSQNLRLLLHADLQQKYVPVLGSIASANIRTLQDNKIYTLEQLNGKLLSFGKNANSDNYLIPLSIQIDNKGNFIPGSFVELYLKTVTNANALTVPNVALLEDQGNYFVFAQINPELFEKREIKIGSSDGLRTEILKGITQSERIVTKGAILIKLAQATGTLDAHSGHNH